MAEQEASPVNRICRRCRTPFYLESGAPAGCPNCTSKSVCLFRGRPQIMTTITAAEARQELPIDAANFGDDESDAQTPAPRKKNKKRIHKRSKPNQPSSSRQISAPQTPGVRMIPKKRWGSETEPSGDSSMHESDANEGPRRPRPRPLSDSFQPIAVPANPEQHRPFFWGPDPVPSTSRQVLGILRSRNQRYFQEMLGLPELIPWLLNNFEDDNPQPFQARGLSEDFIESMLTVEIEQAPYECTICLGRVENTHKVIKLDCGHYFHSKCLTVWLRYSGTCPLCRDVVEAPLDDLSLPPGPIDVGEILAAHVSLDIGITLVTEYDEAWEDGSMFTPEEERREPLMDPILPIDEPVIDLREAIFPCQSGEQNRDEAGVLTQDENGEQKLKSIRNID